MVRVGRKTKLRTNIVVFDAGKCVVKCLKCKTDLAVPLALDMSADALKREQKLIVVQPNT